MQPKVTPRASMITCGDGRWLRMRENEQRERAELRRLLGGIKAQVKEGHGVQACFQGNNCGYWPISKLQKLMGEMLLYYKLDWECYEATKPLG